MSGKSLPSRNIGIRIDEPADFGVVVSALEVVEASFTVIHIAPVAEGVILGQGEAHGFGRGGGSEDIAPSVVGVYDRRNWSASLSRHKAQPFPARWMTPPGRGGRGLVMGTRKNT